MLKIVTMLAILSLGMISGAGTTETIYPVHCIYAFTDPMYPSFTLPPAQPSSPGDVRLNHNNPIRLTNGSSLAAGQGCNSRGISYYEPRREQFLSTYIDSNERNTSFADVIYATQHDQLYARTIQANQANLASFLAERILKIELDCNNGLLGCAYFTVGGEPFNSSPEPLLNGFLQPRLAMTFLVLLWYHVYHKCILPAAIVFSH